MACSTLATSKSILPVSRSSSGMNTHPRRAALGFFLSSTRSTKSTTSTMLLQHINLSCHRSGDQGSAVFLETLDGLLNFGYEQVNLTGFSVEEVGDGELLWHWRRHNPKHW